MEHNLRIAVEAANRLENSLNREITLQLERKQSDAQALIGKLEALSPLNVLSRGFAFVNGVDGVQKKSVKQFRSGESITITLKDGTVEAEVIKAVAKY